MSSMNAAQVLILLEQTKIAPVFFNPDVDYSKKILFTPAQGAQFNPRNIQASKNNLRSMSFR